MRRRLPLAGTALGLLAASGIAAGAESPGVLRVAAAASLTDLVETLAPRFPGARVDASFGGSGALARQIRDGFPADVFLSASPDWIDFLRESGATSGDAVAFARNRLVCIAPLRGAPDAEAAADPSTLLRLLAPGDGVAIADPGVPAGEYARSALRDLELLDAFGPHLVGQKDVRAVLHAVERGELRAGFVYATDAAVAEVRVLFELDPGAHAPIEYRAVVLRGAAHPEEARRFLEFLRGGTASDALTAAGFEVP